MHDNVAPSGGEQHTAQSVAEPARPQKEDCGSDAAVLIGEADRLRDARRYQQAAETYRRALERAPLRTDIRVQFGNMLKDSGQLAEAEAAYRDAVAQAPDDADVNLQLGHVLKLQGHRSAAIDAYRRAAKLAPGELEPIRELATLGDSPAQTVLFEAQLRLGGVETLTSLTHQLVELQSTLNRLLKSLPDIHAQLAVPLACYEVFRAMYDARPPAFSTTPTFGIFLLADGEILVGLRRQIAAIRRQSYENWKLCIIGSDPARRRIAAEAAAGNSRIAWTNIRPGEDGPNAERRRAATSDAEWLLLLAPGARLHSGALAWYSAAAERNPAADAFIADEEVVSSAGNGSEQRSAPELRQVVDYDTLLERNVFGETVVVKRRAYADLVERLQANSVTMARSLLLLELARCAVVGHIPCLLVCRDKEVDAASFSGETTEHEKAVRAHITHSSLTSQIIVGNSPGPLGNVMIRWRAPNPAAQIAMIIPTRDNGDDLEHAIASMWTNAMVHDMLRIVIVDNGSRFDKTAVCIDRLRREYKTSVIVVDEPFNWARLNNHAASLCNSPLLVFANDDVTMLSEGWDENLRGLLGRREIGAVGARLLYPDRTLQHAGVLFGWPGLTIHDGLYEKSVEPGPAKRWHVTRAVSAVTGAFLATRRDVFLAHGAFDEIELPIAFSDIDYALKVRRSGLKIFWTPQITLYHLESKTRGFDHLDPERRARNAAERSVVERRWGAALAEEPSLNPLWHRATLPFRLLSPPSYDRLWAHIDRCAAANPWAP